MDLCSLLICFKVLTDYSYNSISGFISFSNLFCYLMKTMYHTRNIIIFAYYSVLSIIIINLTLQVIAPVKIIKTHENRLLVSVWKKYQYNFV